MTGQPSTASEPKASVTRRRHTHAGFALLLLAPALILLIALTLAPAVYAFILSLQQQKVSGGLFGGETTMVFVGLTNYLTVLSSNAFWVSMGRMLIVAVIGVPLTIILALIFALCLDADRAKLVGVWRIIIFLPYAVPGVIASLLWGFLYLPSTSPIGGQAIRYLSGNTVYFSVANVAAWSVIGFNMIIMYTTLKGLPHEVYEAARIDGASELQIALRIKVPMIRPVITMCLMFSVLGALQLFNEPVTLQGLSNTINASWVPLMQVYTLAFRNNNISAAAATSLLLVAMTIVASLIVTGIGSVIRGKNK